LGAWRLTVGAHEQKLNTKKYAAALSFPNVYLLYNTVVLIRSVAVNAPFFRTGLNCKNQIVE
jgi:hypothetical protein